MVGSTGAGKSCGIAALLHGLVDKYPAARVIVLDVHNEYSVAFRGKAEIVTPANLFLPFWLLSFDELASVFATSEQTQAEDLEILHDAVMNAKKRAGEAMASRQAGALRRVSENVARVWTLPRPTGSPTFPPISKSRWASWSVRAARSRCDVSGRASRR